MNFLQLSYGVLLVFTISTNKTDNLYTMIFFVSPCKYAIGYVNSSPNFHTKTGGTLLINYLPKNTAE